MLLDLSKLHRIEDSKATLVRDGARYASADQLPQDGFTSEGTHAGQIRLGIDRKAFVVDASLITKVYIKQNGSPNIEIGLELPSPIPGHMGVENIGVKLKFSGGMWLVEVSDVAWFNRAVKFSGGINEWLKVNAQYDVGLENSGNNKVGFPLDHLGTMVLNHEWPTAQFYKRSVPHGRRSDDEEKVEVVNARLGLFLVDGTMHFVFLPSIAGYTSNPVQIESGVRLLGLESRTLKRSGRREINVSYAPILLSRRMTDAGSGDCWNVRLGWVLHTPDQALKNTQLLKLSDVLQAAWNEPVRLAMRGNLVERPGTPAVALPTLSISADGDSEKSYPILLFDIPRPSAKKEAAQARLRRIHVCGTDPRKVTATFRFQAPAIGLAGDTVASDPKYPDDATLSSPPNLTFELKLEGELPRSTELPLTFAPLRVNNLGVSNIIQASALATPAQDDLLLDTTVTKLEAFRRPGGNLDAWLTWGSLEFRLPSKLGDGSTVRLMLRGDWTEDQRNLYPEIDLRLKSVEVRFSAAGDLSGAHLGAAFDVETAAEDRLHRDTASLIHRFGSESVTCDLRIRHKTAPGRNSVTRLEVRSTNVKGKWGPKVLHLQLRPFMVAQTNPLDIDAEAGELIAVWSSDDPEGAQWRLPDASVEVLLPPQAIGETMERGVRFWGEKAAQPDPVVKPAKVLPFRFSPPTKLTLRPSLQPRRYNRSPANVATVLSQARVESFVTEIAYPIQTTFKVSERDGLPDVRIKETAGYIGRSGPSLPTRSFSGPWSEEDIADVKGYFRDLLANAPADYLAGLLPKPSTSASGGKAPVKPPETVRQLLRQLQHIARAHTANRRNFAARLAQYHLYDPFRADGALALSQGLNFRIRSTREGAAPLRNPLPRWSIASTGSGPAPQKIDTDLSSVQKESIKAFLDSSAAPDWSDSGATGLSILGGVAHTIEFASELVAVLSKPHSDIGAIDHLAFTALGANAGFHCAFDEGRTLFYAESQHGQLSRLIKVRIGRLGVLWNKARHVVVYERSTVPSVQFKEEQQYAGAESRGWPILRKTEEYVEPVEPLRAFGAERQKDSNHTAFVEASEVVSPRIYVNGAWGRDLEHGYEIPLWNPDEASGFYPKPELALWGQAGDGTRNRLCLQAPQHVYFYSNTRPNAGADPDRWAAMPGVDCPVGLHRLPARAQRKPAAAEVREVLERDRLPPPRATSLSRPRFDFAVLPTGKVNLQQGRGDSEILVDLELVALMRSDSAAAPPLEGRNLNSAWRDVVKSVEGSEKLASLADLEGQIRSKLQQAFERLRTAPATCETIKSELIGLINKVFEDAKNDLKKELPKLPKIELPKLATQAANDIQKQLQAMATALHAPFGVLRRDIAALRAAAVDANDEELKKLRTIALGQWMAGVALVDGVFEQAIDRLNALEHALKKVQGNEADRLLNRLGEAIDPLKSEIEKEKKDGIIKSLSEAHGALVHLSGHRLFGKTAAELARLVQTARDLVSSGVPLGGIKDSLTDLQEKLNELHTHLKLDPVHLGGSLTKIRSEVNSRLEQISNYLRDSHKHPVLEPILREAISAIDALAARADASAEERKRTIVGGFREQAEEATKGWVTSAGEIDNASRLASESLVNLLKDVAAKLDDVFKNDGAIGEIREKALKRVTDVVDCSALQAIAEAEAALRRELESAGNQIRAKFTGYANELLDADARRRLADLEVAVSGATQLADKAGSAIKLARALGDLPALPTLSFNLDRAEYFFEDARKTIDTSPFAAKLREVDAGIKELGLAVPCRQLLDQMVPDSLKGLDFKQIFRNVGGIDFQRLFKRFKLPEISSDRVKLTHGLDKTTRTAWVRSRVDFAHDKQETLFDLAGFALQIHKLKLLADNEVRVSAKGERSSSTDAAFTGDWALHFSGTDLARIREITVRYDGAKPDFDFSPDKLELHPSLQFLTEFTAGLSASMPPGVEVLKDGRGKPIGVKASVVNEFKGLEAPPVSIGAMTIAAGLGLQVLGVKGELHIAAHLSVGSRQEPVWVQIGYLGGGLWLEARASYVDQVHYSASVGMALGVARSFSLAGVARGSFALLLYVYMEVEDTGGSLRAGFSITGSARILGIANATVLLLMEVEHRGGSGGSTGRGILDVKIRISRFYKIHVHRQVEKRIGR